MPSSRFLSPFGEVQASNGRLSSLHQVGLHDDAHRGAAPKARLGEELLGGLQEHLARVERLHVEMQVRSKLAGGSGELAESRARVGGTPRRRLGANERCQRGQLQREVGAWDRPVTVRLGKPWMPRPARADAGKTLELDEAAIAVGVRLGGGDRRLAEQVEGEELAAAPASPKLAGGGDDVAPGDEAPCEEPDRRPRPRAGEGGEGSAEARRGEASARSAAGSSSAGTWRR